MTNNDNCDYDHKKTVIGPDRDSESINMGKLSKHIVVKSIQYR